MGPKLNRRIVVGGMGAAAFGIPTGSRSQQLFAGMTARLVVEFGGAPHPTLLPACFPALAVSLGGTVFVEVRLGAG